MTQVIRDKWKKPQWQGFSPTSEWSQIQILGFRGPPGGCALYDLPSLVDTRRSSSVSQPDKVILQGKLPHEKDHAISPGLHATLGISYFSRLTLLYGPADVRGSKHQKYSPRHCVTFIQNIA